MLMIPKNVRLRVDRADRISRIAQGGNNMKRFANAALVYGALALAGGVFLPEFTRLSGFTGRTSLGLVHAHYLVLGTGVCLLFAAAGKERALGARRAKWAAPAYHIGLNLTALGLLVRGVVQVCGASLSPALNGALSGTAGLGHLALGAAALYLLVHVRRSVNTKAKTARLSGTGGPFAYTPNSVRAFSSVMRRTSSLGQAADLRQPPGYVQDQP